MKRENWKIIKFSEATTKKEVVENYAALSFKCAQRYCDDKKITRILCNVYRKYLVRV